MKQAVLFCIFFMALWACKKDHSTSTSASSGSLVVHVTLYDEMGNKIDGAGGVTIALYKVDSSKNTALFNNTPYSTGITDASGSFTFNNLPGAAKDSLLSYTIKCSKPNFGTVIQYNFVFVPESSTYTFSTTMAAMSKTTISNLKFTLSKDTASTSDTVWLSCHIDSLKSPYTCVRFFWGVESNITTDSNYVAMVLCNTITDTLYQDSSHVIGFFFIPSQYYVNSTYITKGTPLYAIAYGEVNVPTPYTDITVLGQKKNGILKFPNGITIYPNLDTAQTIKLKADTLSP